MPNWRNVLDGVDRFVRGSAAFGWQVLLWPLVYSVAWSAAAWPLGHRERIVDWGKNDLSDPERIVQLNYLLGAGAIMFALLAAFLVSGRIRTGEWRLSARSRAFNRFFSFSLAAPFMVALTQPHVELRRPLYTLFLIVLVTLSGLPTVASLWEIARKRRKTFFPEQPSRVGIIVPASIVVGLLAGYTYWFSRLSINSHHALKTRIFDLAIYDNIFYQSSHGNPLGCSLSGTGSHLSGHFDPILVLLSPLYYIYPQAELILALQAVWCAAGVIPAYLLGRRHVGSVAAGLTFALAWALYPPLHGANLYEFHSLTLLATPMLWLLYFLTSKKTGWYYALLPLVLLVREDVSLLLCCVGAATILTGDARLTRAGWVTLTVSAVYFVVTKTVIMASVDPVAVTPIEQVDPLGGKHGFAWYYTELIPKGGSLRDLVTTLLTNPIYAFGVALKEKKLIFLLQLLVPLAFLPLFGKPWRLMTAFGLFYLLMATRNAVFSIHFQYSVVLFPVLFALAAIGLRRLRDGRLPSVFGMVPSQLTSVLLAAVLLSSVLMSWKFGGIFENAAFRGGFHSVPRTLSAAQIANYEELREFVSLIPPDAALTVVGRVGPHLSNRPEVYNYRHKRPSDFLVFDTRDLKGHAKKSYRKRLDEGKLERVASKGRLRLYKIKKPGDPPVLQPPLLAPSDEMPPAWKP